MLQLSGKISSLRDMLTQIPFKTQNVYSYIETLSISNINQMLINLPDLQYILYDIKDQLRSHFRLDIPANIESDICSDYRFLKIQAFVLTYTLVILSIPLSVTI